MAEEIGLEDLLQAGVHFGHQTHRWNPKMRRYIFAERGGIYLIDLQKSLHQLRRAKEVIREVVDEGEQVLFVCTKPQLAEIVRTEAERCGAFWVTERWLGGMLTNFQTIKGNIQRLKELERGAEEGAFDHYTKKEQLLLDRERQKLERYLSGIKDMSRLPGLVYVVDAKKEEIAVKEANRLDIPVVAIADTNADPDRIDVPVPGNDDAISSVSLITKFIADSVEAARQEAPAAAVEEAEVYTYSTDAGETAEVASARGRERSRPRRRPRPEVIAQRRQEGDEETGGEEEGAGEEPAEVAAEGEEPAESEAEQEPAEEIEAEADQEPAEAEADGEPASGDEEEADVAATAEAEATEDEEREEVAPS